MTGCSLQQAKERLYDAIRGDDPFERKARAALEAGVEYLGVENGHLTRIDQETDHWEATVSTDPPEGEYPPGLELDLGTTYCRRTLEADAQITLHDAPNQGWEDDPAFEEHGLHCYHGTTLVLDGEPYGTVCFVDSDPREEFREEENVFTELLARLLERELERQRHEAELTKQANLTAVLNRVLRHNLRNDLSIIRGHTQLMADQVDGDGFGETALRNIDDLIQLSEKARELDRVVAAEDERSHTEITALVEEVCADVSESHPDASITVRSEEELTVAVREDFQRAIEELVENAVKHGGQEPTVTVEVDPVPNAVEIRVVDDGPGLSSQESAVLETGAETPLTHGSGLGLWLVHWIVTSHGGSTTATTDESGTTMTVTVPRKPATDVHQQLAKLSRARDRYHAAFEEANDAMVIINDEARIVEANPEARTIYGLSSRELLGRELVEFLPPGFDFEAAWQQFRDAGNERDTVTIVDADGVERPVEYSATTEIVPGHHLVISRDISDRVERERRLEETRSRLRAIIEASPDPVMAIDPDGTVQLWNEAAEEVFQYTESEALGTPIGDLELHSADQRAAFRRRFERAMAGETLSDIVVERTTRDGDTVYLNISASPIRGDDGTVNGVMAVCKDVTEHVEQKRRFEALADGFPDLCFIIDEDGVYREVLSNPTNEDKLYADPAEFIGNTMEEVLPAPTAERTLAAVRETIETGEPQTVEYELTVPAGRRVFQARLAPLGLEIDGKPTVSCVVRDVTRFRDGVSESATS